MGLINFILDQKRRGEISDIASGVQSGQIPPNEALLRYAMATGDSDAFQAGAKQSALSRLYQQMKGSQPQNGSVGDTQPDQPIPQTLPDQDSQPQAQGYMPSVAALASTGMFDLVELTKLARQQQELELERGRLNLANQQLEMGRIPSGYRKSKDGNLEPIPGGPASLLSNAVPTTATSAAPQASTEEGMAAPVPSTLTGDAFLKTLPPDKANMVRALADGRMQFPRSMGSSKNPYWQNILDAVAQYDPDFDAANYNARSQTRKAFTSGKEATSVNALNTVAEHLGKLKEAHDNLRNTNIPAINAAQNWVGQQIGSSRKTTFDTIVGPVAEEMVRAYRGVGGNEADIKRHLDTLNSNLSPEQAKKSFEALGDLLKGKIDALRDQYQRGMGTAAEDRRFYTPEAVKAFKSIGLDLNDQLSPAPAASPSSSLSSMSLEELKALRERLAGGGKR